MKLFKIITTLGHFVLLSLQLSLSGCIIIPVLEPGPYQEDELAKIYPRVSSRDEVVELLGRPQVVRQQDSIWIYGGSALQALIIASHPGSIIDFQLVLVEFEQDTVKNIELIEDKHGCSSRGICVLSGWDWRLFTLKSVAIVSKREDDLVAKGFRKIPDKCSLYVYTGSNWWNGNDFPPLITVGLIQGVPVHAGSYINTILNPGVNKIFAKINMEISGNDPRYIDRKEMLFDCEAGSHVFIETSYRAGFSVTVKIKQVDEGDGVKAILNRSLLILP